MPTIRKIVVSGSAISQLNNDVNYLLTVGDGVISSSAQIATNITGAFTALSGGLAGRINTLETQGATNAQTASFVLSDNVKFTVTVSGTSSFETLTEVSTSIAADIASLEATVGAGGLLSSSAQIATNISGAFTSVSESIATDIAANTTSIATNVTNIGTLTSQTSSYALKTQVSGAFTATSASIAEDIALLQGAVGSGGTLISSSVEGDAQGQIKFNGINVDANNLGTGDSPQFTNLTLTGDLFVGGATTTINTANLNIEDKFILLNSGSSGATAEGGIIVEASGSGVGNAFYYDSTETRWSVAEGVNYDDTAVTPEAFMSVAIIDTLANAESSSYYQAGNIIVDGQDIYIVTV